MTGIRIAAALLLALHLNQLALPVLCLPPDRAPAACHESQPAGTAQVTSHSSSHALPCADSAMCGVPVTGLPETSVTLGEPAVHSFAVLPLGLLEPGDQLPPLSPPPQA
ncbi:MAG TPA: hypothetical protein VFU41_09040 [Gemmatimonadales bacterium]|nr:hypothetical protein [Gemmatimonadales bacterium]